MDKQHPSKSLFNRVTDVTIFRYGSKKSLDTAAEIATPRTAFPSSSKTSVKYLAYGSNLSAETFLGRRGIKPLSQVNVVVPSLELTFDLGGIPYWEPCMANVRWLDESARENRFNPEHTPTEPSEQRSLLLEKPNTASTDTNGHKTRCVTGVVYEVTATDYAHIIATEGGYDQVSVECFPLDTPPPPSLDLSLSSSSSSSSITDKQPPKSFIAQTLLAPSKRIRTPPPGSVGPAQPSERYLNLLIHGAREHSLPVDYQEYLESFTFYERRTLRQKMGGIIVAGMWAPLIIFVVMLKSALTDKDGRAPEWVMNFMDFLFKSVWISHDLFYRRIFGSGERTEDVKDEMGAKGDGEKTDERKGQESVADGRTGEGSMYGSMSV